MKLDDFNKILWNDGNVGWVSCEKEPWKAMTDRDSCILVEIYEKFHDYLSSKFSGPSAKQAKKKAWERFVEEYNNANPDFIRDQKQIDNRIESYESTVKGKNSYGTLN